MKKLITLVVVAAFVFIGVGAMKVGCGNTDKQLNFSDISGYADIFETPIEKINLRESVTSAEWAVFEDEDLIGKWKKFLSNTTLEKETDSLDQSSDTFNGGGPAVAVLTVNGKEYSIKFYLDSNQVEVDDELYDVDLSDCPFKECFVEAVNRHGVVTPWGKT